MNIIAEKFALIAKELREHPERWTQGTLAKDASGHSVDPESSQAVCWCTIGLIDKHIPIMSAENMVAYNVAKSAAANPSLSYWNDRCGRTVQEVADMFECAANKARAIPPRS